MPASLTRHAALTRGVPLSFRGRQVRFADLDMGGQSYRSILLLTALAGCASMRPTTVRDERQLRAEVAELRTAVDDLKEKVAALTKRMGTVPSSKASQRTLDQRLSVIEERLGGTRSGARAPAPAVSPRVPPSTPAPELDVDGLRRESARQLPSDYERGLALVRNGDYEQAIQAMRDFVRAENGSPFVAGAHYWIGQSHLQLGQHYQAILSFTEVQQRFPRSEYAPAAGLAGGLAFLQLGNGSEARRAFEKVVSDYPTSPEAAKARVRLAEPDAR